ncbi:MAG: hypothetical protein KatS3mg036_0193 [Ignavibacterium sp.]|nr:MAG: hypothetical protein KatS3mg036_0193 [Ignavibacterium sp.]
MFYKVFIEKWEQIKAISTKSSAYVFRGHKEREWELKPTLERAANKFYMNNSQLFGHEYLILREFQSVAGQYLNKLPNNKNLLEWYSLLQHYGAPTRLLDFTRSIYVAAFFAFESSCNESVIWGLNHQRLDEFLYNKLLKEHNYKLRNLIFLDYKIDIANKILNYENQQLVQKTREEIFCNKDMIFTVDCSRKNIRHHIQKSVFLIPSSLERSFTEILTEQFDFKFSELTEDNAESITFEELYNKRLNYETCLFKLVIPKEVSLEGLYDLNNMNINALTLFPGLDGFARSLNLIMRNMERVSLKNY